MKKLIIIATAISILTSCVGPKLTSRVVTSSLLDFRGYAESGFLVSPYAYTTDYEAIGELEVYVLPANIKTADPKSDFNIKIYTQEDITRQELADIAVEEAKKTGADALVNFKIQKIPVPNSYEHFFSLTGFCIKRK